MEYFLGIDLGTSYFKAGVFDKNGNLKGLGRKFVKKEGANGYICELPVEVFWKTLHSCIGESIKKAGINPRYIKAVSYSSQTNSFILLDSKEKPLTPLILWPDKRAAEIGFPSDYLYNKKEFLSKTGLGFEPDSDFAITKINWLQKKEPKLWERVKSVLSISDYLTLRLTGQKVCDLSTASMTGLLDVENCQWWDKSLQMFSLDSAILSSPKRMGDYVGPLTKSGAKITGLVPGISYYLGGLDHHCAAIGSGIIQNDYVCESTGTVLSCVGYSSKYTPKTACFTAPGLEAGKYFRMAFNSNGASGLEWYQKNFAANYSIPELLIMAEKIKSSSEGLHARPGVNNYKGLTGFDNVRPFHKHGHFIRAILESTASSLADLTTRMMNPVHPKAIVSTGGGAQSKFWIKIKADKLKTVFYIPECRETACLGSAMIGAKGSGEQKNWLDLIERWVRFSEIVTPVFVNNS